MYLLPSSVVVPSFILGIALVSSTAHADLIFNNGSPGPTGGYNFANRVLAEDFSVTVDADLQSVEFWALQDAQIQTISYYLFTDESDSPSSSAIASGTGLDLVGMDTGRNFNALDEYRYTFNLESDVSLSTGTEYWFGLRASGGGSQNLFWSTTTSGQGLASWESLGGTFDNWAETPSPPGYPLAFNLSGIATTAAVPEPSSLVVVGVVALALIYRRRTRPVASI